MANANTGVITIKFVEGSKKIPGPEPINDKMAESGSSESQGNAIKDAISNALIQRAGRQLKGMVISEAKYRINLYFRMTDNYLGQQNLNIALNVIDKAWNTGKSVASWATTGAAVGGPWGAVIGAVVGLGLSVISTALEISHNYEQEHIKINQMNVGLQFNRQRAGFSLTAGSIGENK